MADYMPWTSTAIRLQSKFAAAWTADELRRRRRRRQEFLDAGEDDAADSIGVDFDAIVEDQTLCVSDNGATANVHHIAAFLQELVRLGYVQDPVAFSWADTCSKSRADAFTGGAVVVTARKLYWFVVPDLVEQKLAALQRRRQRRA